MSDYALRSLTTFLMIFLTHLPFSNEGTEMEANRLEMERFLWVDSVLTEMSPREKIGQLLMLRAHSDLGEAHVSALKRQMRDLEPGGICLFQGTEIGHKRLVEDMQGLSSSPLFVSIDAEWGLNMRLKEVDPFPKQMSLGALNNPEILRDMGRLMAEECQGIGVNFNFAPVVDVNNNPANPVINYRSFGEDPERVASLAEELYKGMSEGGMMACAKHFPGHGDTQIDSHKDLPVIDKSIEQLRSTELVPFNRLIHSGVPAIMTAHLHLPKLDAAPDLPASLSSTIVQSILQKDMNFRGLVVTDALEMKGVRKHFSNGEIAVKAFKAGSHILLLPEDPYEAANALERALQSGEIDMETLNRRVSRILYYKHKFIISKEEQNADSTNLKLRKQKLFRKIAKQSICLLKNSENILPLSNDYANVHHLALGASANNAFTLQLSRIADLASSNNKLNPDEFSVKELYPSPDKEDLMIVSLHMENQKPSSNYGISDRLIQELVELDRRCRLLVVYFGNAYGLRSLTGFPSLVMGQEALDSYMRETANAVFGFSGFQGVLPVSLGEGFSAGAGLTLDKQYHLEYSRAHELGMHQDQLDSITLLLRKGVHSRAFPSAVVLVARKGEIVYHHAEGHTDYRKNTPVRRNFMYDLASVTKVAATGLSLMKLVDQGKLFFDQKLGAVLTEARGTNKEDLTIGDIMQHRAGLKPWIPFYENTVQHKKWNKVLADPVYYSDTPKPGFEIPVDGRLYLRNDFRDSIFQQVCDSELLPDKDYVYSDLGFMLLMRVVEEISGMPFDDFFEEKIARPLNLEHCFFKPSEKPLQAVIPPTEEDDYFRGGRIQAHVHDMAAAMLGGVSGHAGLFGNAYDLASLMQMLLNGGQLGSQRMLSDSVISSFTRRYDDTRRGLCFDMKQLDDNKKLNIHKLASDRCFGHFGFTGTAVWVDPECDLIYIFLSNRTYPDMQNGRINTMDIRNRIQGMIYRSMTDEYET
ncbi:MAG TPA: glycoside hydrolase family 3 N-terminal domain-containing protein [Saprospiraceae bacterium]|nr:glycoside hydrolase family 3 N-terminal domain-containing protein [Saprospiraceae bacterium]